MVVKSKCLPTPTHFFQCFQSCLNKERNTAALLIWLQPLVHFQRASMTLKRRFHLEVVRRVAVSVLGYVQEDEQVLSEVVGRSGQPGEAGGGQAEVHHLSGRRARWLDELTGATFATDEDGEDEGFKIKANARLYSAFIFVFFPKNAM